MLKDSQAHDCVNILQMAFGDGTQKFLIWNGQVGLQERYQDLRTYPQITMVCLQQVKAAARESKAT